MMVDMIKREFEVSGGNYSGTVHVHPNFMERVMEAAGENLGRAPENFGLEMDEM